MYMDLALVGTHFSGEYWCSGCQWLGRGCFGGLGFGGSIVAGVCFGGVLILASIEITRSIPGKSSSKANVTVQPL